MLSNYLIFGNSTIIIFTYCSYSVVYIKDVKQRRTIKSEQENNNNKEV